VAKPLTTERGNAISDKSLRQIAQLRRSGETWSEIAKEQWAGRDGRLRKYHADTIRKLVAGRSPRHRVDTIGPRITKQQMSARVPVHLSPLIVDNPPGESWKQWTLRYMGFTI
jgi:hypothetical protein